MARRNDDRSIYELIILLITILGIVIKFLIEVNKRGLWKECIISVGIVYGLNYTLYEMSNQNILPFSVFGWSCLISFIVFCVYWSGLFNNSPYGQFSKGSLKRNSSHWSEQAWWWGLDGWQFEQEVAKIFILQGYKATVTKGSGDGGVDIILQNGNYTAIVQCKHHRNPVPPEPIRALWGCKDDYNADEVILIASSGITQAGADFINNKPEFRVLNLDDIIFMSEHSEQYKTVKQPEYIENMNENINETNPAPTKPSKITGRNSIGRRVDI